MLTCTVCFPKGSHQRFGPEPADEGGVDDAQQRVGGERQHRGARQVPHRPVVAVRRPDADPLERPPAHSAAVLFHSKIWRQYASVHCSNVCGSPLKAPCVEQAFTADPAETKPVTRGAMASALG